MGTLLIKQVTLNGEKKDIYIVDNIISKIADKVDVKLAELYQVETKVLKQTVRRNLDRFPEDFMFELTEQEHNSLIII